MGYSPWGHRESDTTERLHFLTVHIQASENPLLPRYQGDPIISPLSTASPMAKATTIPELVFLMLPIPGIHDPISSLSQTLWVKTTPLLLLLMILKGWLGLSWMVFMLVSLGLFCGCIA